MADQSKLEQMLEKLVNNDREGADSLFHEFVIEKSQVQTIFKPRPQLETNYKVATGNNVRGQIQK